ncbi:hypothetical protein PAA8504_00384 [Palleronia abyssalis]|uniref:Uncharacterized protein n=1 Tax=Palleronia abyssalis TaxID=1501240 RepID=A0A2R8BR07_9RHOB|nr:hypothetical protein PAA8504_00384 [Palleronia abyssalis]
MYSLLRPVWVLCDRNLRCDRVLMLYQRVAPRLGKVQLVMGAETEHRGMEDRTPR